MLTLRGDFGCISLLLFFSASYSPSIELPELLVSYKRNKVVTNKENNLSLRKYQKEKKYFYFIRVDG